VVLNIETVCEIGKGLSVKREKSDDEDIVRCHLKFSDCAVERNAIDQLLGLPEGIVQSFFDDLGAPLAKMVLGAPGRELGATGRILGTKPREVLTLGADCELTDIEVALKDLGGLLSGTLTWTARGDEVEDVTDLLGRTCKVHATIIEPQGDLLKPKTAEKPAARRHSRAAANPDA
jgi:hypothetical protein